MERDWLDEMVSNIEEAFDANAREKDKCPQSHKQLRNAPNCPQNRKRQKATNTESDWLDEMVSKIEETFEGHPRGKDHNRRISNNQEISDVNQKLPSGCTEVEEETEDNGDAGFACEEDEEPAVVVELVGDVTMEMLKECSLEVVEFENSELITSEQTEENEHASRITTTDSSVTENNAETTQQQALDDVTDSSEAAEPLINNEKKTTTCRHLHDELTCKVCALEYRAKWNVIRHSRGKTYACRLCDYTTINSNAVKVHSRIHTGDKPYACHLCYYRTTQKCHLNSHMLTHTGEKRFKCEDCGYRTNNTSHLKSHMRIHRKKNLM